MAEELRRPPPGFFVNRPTPNFVVHNWSHVSAALIALTETDQAGLLYTPPGASFTLGVGYIAAMEERARQEFPEAGFLLVTDCDDAPGHVMSALRMGLKTLVFTGDALVRDKLEDMAHQVNAVLVPRPEESLDLIEEADPLGACQRWLAAFRASNPPIADDRGPARTVSLPRASRDEG
jgi:hypothetical protein